MVPAPATRDSNILQQPSRAGPEPFLEPKNPGQMTLGTVESWWTMELKQNIVDSIMTSSVLAFTP